MAGVKWIKICTDIFDDEKVVLIDSMPKADSIIVIWFKLLCLAGKQNNGGVFMLNDKIAYTDDMLAHIFRRPVATVKLALKTFVEYGMIEIVDKVVTIPNWEKHQSLDALEKARAQNQKRVAAYRDKQKATNADDCNGDCNADCNVTVTLQTTECNADVTPLRERDLEEENKDKVSQIPPARAHVESGKKGAFYGLNDFLSAYPNVRNDVKNEKDLDGLDFQALAKAFKESEWLRGVDSLSWILQNAQKVIDGAYKTFKADKAGHFAGEREYTPGELNSLLKNVDDIDF